ncbi:MAG: hypothetical protein OEL87_02430 [Nanoarchaeota archaeon]|nr:hypothetical protein [Nanoarchaeota archaeon]
MKKMMISILAIVLMTGFAFAANGPSGSAGSTDGMGMASSSEMGGSYEGVQGSTNLTMSQVQAGAQERRQLQNQVMSNIKESLMAGEEMRVGEKLMLKRVNGEMELRGGNGSAVKTKLQLNNEGDATKLKVKLSNGRNAEVKIMPETASVRALERLRLKNCNETVNNCTIELKEVGEGNQTRAVYEAKTRKTFRVFGMFRSEREVLTQIDAETGEEIMTRRPWWSWMASEKEE